MPREGVAARMRVRDFGGIVVVVVVFEDWGGRLLMAQWCGFSRSCDYRISVVLGVCSNVEIFFGFEAKVFV